MSDDIIKRSSRSTARAMAFAQRRTTASSDVGQIQQHESQYAPMNSRLPMASPLWRKMAYAVVT